MSQQLTNPTLLQNVKTLEELRRFVTFSLEEIKRTVNGRLRFKANLRATGPLTVALTTAESAVAHNLGVVPTGFLVVGLSANAVVFNGTKAWTGDTIYLRASTTVTATLYVI